MDSFDLEVYNALHELGIPVHVRGYEFLKSAMKYLHANPQSIYAMTKEFYPAIAEMYGVKASHVERGIRTALGLSKADDATWQRVLGRSGHMSNSEFLATLNETIRVKLASGESHFAGSEKYLEFHENRDELQMQPNDYKEEEG